MKRLTAVLAALALCLATLAPAQAGGYYRGYKHYGHGHYGYKHRGYRHHRHSNTGAYVALGILGGALLLGALLSRPSYGGGPSTRSGYAPPPRPAHRNCQQTTGNGLVNGRPALFGGTWCRDAYGNGYIVPGSEYFIGYTQ